VTAIMVLAQLGISTQILTVLAAIAAGGAALGLALAFGLGSREVARDISAGRYVASAYRVGQRVRVAGVEGEIVALESACAVLSGPGGETLRIPHHLFLRDVVAVAG
jgi:small-conductance mechanosensitive channel